MFYIFMYCKVQKLTSFYTFLYRAAHKVGRFFIWVHMEDEWDIFHRDFKVMQMYTNTNTYSNRKISFLPYFMKKIISTLLPAIALKLDQNNFRKNRM